MITFKFPATRGIQAGKEFFSATVPYAYLVRLFRFDEETVPAELRAQRKLDEKRAGKIGEYVVENAESYVLPAITASVDKAMSFTPAGEGDLANIGILNVPIDATMLINDGQHRRRGIELAIRENPALASESVTMTLFFDQGLKSSQQMFSDINGNATKPSGSISALYDLRNPFNKMVLEILGGHPAIKAAVDMEQSTVGKKSPKIWTLVAMQKFITMMTGIKESNYDKSDVEAASVKVHEFINRLSLIPRWDSMINGLVSAEAMREDHIIGHTVFLHALALLGKEITDMDQLAGLKAVETLKTAQVWQGRCVVQGKMHKTTDGVKATAAVLMNLCGVKLPKDIAQLDEALSQEELELAS